MATHRIPILGWSAVPDSSGNVFFEPYDVPGIGSVLLPGAPCVLLLLPVHRSAS